ncbi:DUF5995 family protein [Tomitella biformata]|uniref:DUF5995 family protein n=1 Tax=Tomitella biformata TaxID=630403 RepID=UPI0004647C77|nr:DUF5995 family protein [Tomitella biformata]
MHLRRSFSAAFLAAAIAFAGIAPAAANSTAAVPTADSPASSCRPASDAESDARLAELTDPAGVTTFDEAQERISALRTELSNPEDLRGTFPIAFDNILDLVGPSIESGIYDDSEWATALAVEVVRLYLAGLHEYVTGGTPAAHWAAAFALTEDCDRSPGRVLLGQIFAHLIIDFPHALVTIGTTPEHTHDFYTFGEALVDATPAIATDFEATYGVDLGPLFTGWFVGDVIGDKTTTTVMFQSVRTAALINSFGLQNPATRDATLIEMDLLLRAANLSLDGMELAGLI